LRGIGYFVACLSPKNICWKIIDIFNLLPLIAGLLELY
jgi:hypothetical protein